VTKALAKWFPSLPRWVNFISSNSLANFRQVFLVKSQLLILGLPFSFHLENNQNRLYTYLFF
jgi:hypothetical protein